MDRFIIYCVIGGINTAIDLSAFVFLTIELKMAAALANFISCMAALCVSFVLNRTFTSRSSTFHSDTLSTGLFLSRNQCLFAFRLNCCNLAVVGDHGSDSGKARDYPVGNRVGLFRRPPTCISARNPAVLKGTREGYTILGPVVGAQPELSSRERLHIHSRKT